MMKKQIALLLTDLLVHFLEGSQLYGEQMIHDFEPSSELIQEYA